MKKRFGKVLVAVGISIGIGAVMWAAIALLLPSGWPLELLSAVTAFLGVGYLTTVLGIKMRQEPGGATNPIVERVQRSVGTAVIGGVIIVCSGSFCWNTIASGLGVDFYTALENSTVAWLIPDKALSSKSLYIGPSKGDFAPEQLTELRRQFPLIDLHRLADRDTQHEGTADRYGLNVIELKNVSFRTWGVARVDVRTLGCAGFVDAFYIFGKWHKMGQTISCPLLHIVEPTQ